MLPLSTPEQLKAGSRREIVEDWASHPVNIRNPSFEEAGKRLHQSFPGQPFPRMFMADLGYGEDFVPSTNVVRYDDGSGCLLSEDGRTLVACVDPELTVRVPDTVETIGSRAFSGFNVHQVVLPDNLRVIEPYAFHCTAIRDLELPGSIESIGTGAFCWVFPPYLDDLFLTPDGPTRIRMEENSGPYEVVDDYLLERKSGEVRLLSSFYPYTFINRGDCTWGGLDKWGDRVIAPGDILFAPPEGVTRLATDCVVVPGHSYYEMEIRLPRSLIGIEPYAVRDAQVKAVNVPPKLVDAAHDFWRYVGPDLPFIYERFRRELPNGRVVFDCGEPLSHFPLSRGARVYVDRRNPRYCVFAGEFHIGPPVV